MRPHVLMIKLSYWAWAACDLLKIYITNLHTCFEVLCCVACSAGVFFGRANVYARVSAIKDGGYNNTNTKRVSLTQNTPALQAVCRALGQSAKNSFKNREHTTAHICCGKLTTFRLLRLIGTYFMGDEYRAFSLEAAMTSCVSAL